MNIPIPPDWRRIGKVQFVHAIDGLNWKKDFLGYYIHVTTGERFAINTDEGLWVDPLYLPDDD